MKLIFSKKSILSMMLSVIILSSCDVLTGVSSSFPGIADAPLTEGEIINGLKKALDIGTGNSVTSASSVNGYLRNEAIKILLPDDVKNLQQKIDGSNVASAAYRTYVNRFNGGTDLFDELLTSMNRGAESAASKAKPIFVNAITSMTIQDAKGILDGNNTAATDYFYRTTNQDLFSAFQPEVKKALDNTGANSVYKKTYDFLSYDPGGLGLTTVGKLLDVSIAPSMDEYATNMAIDGLFHLVGQEEQKIRADPFSWGSDIIERVFGSKK